MDGSGDFFLGKFQPMYIKAFFVALEKFKEKTDFEYFQKLALEGNADAQFNLGNAYASAHGVHLDHDKAEEWWKKAAEQGHTDAQHNLLALSNMKEKLLNNTGTHALPTLGNDGLTLENFSSSELLADIRGWQEELTQHQKDEDKE